jgi:hypothetical protein
MKRTPLRRVAKGKLPLNIADDPSVIEQGGYLWPVPKRRRVSKKGKHEKKALDDLCRAIVFARDGSRCQWYGTTSNLQWAHIHSRRYLSSRWRLENSLVLSAKAHLEWHHRPLEAVAWFREKFPERAMVLDRIAAFPQKVDLKLERLYLMAEAQKYGVDTSAFTNVVK